MRIAVCHNQPSGGARRALHGFCSVLGERHALDFFTFDTSDDEWLHDSDLADNVHRAGLRRRTPVRFGLYVNDLLTHLDQRDLDAAYAAMAARVDAGGYDVALIDVCRFSLVPSILGHLGTPSVFYAHNGPGWLEQGDWDPPRTAWERGRHLWHRPLTRLQEASLAARQRSSARAASRVATNSEHTAQRMRAAYGVEPVVCPPGVAVPPEPAGRRSSYVLSVGEVEPRKGFSFLVDALGCLDADTRPPLRIVANRANVTELARLERRARQAGVALEVVVAPGERALAGHYAEAKLFVYAAHAEPLGLAPLEAMAHGTPVVAVAEGGVPETVVSGVTGYLTDRDAPRFAERVHTLLGDDRARAAMGRAARAHVEQRWAMTQRAEALEALLAATARAWHRVAT